MTPREEAVKTELINNKRNSRLELLRIICMLMIVAYHYSVYGFYAEDLLYSQNKTLAEALTVGGEMGVNIFVLISGYYMVTSRYSMRKFLLYAGQIWFYTIGTFALFMLLPALPDVFNRQQLLFAFLPLSSGHYWFATGYLLLMLLSPFLNVFLKNAGRNQAMGAALVMSVIYFVLPGLGVGATYSTLGRLVALYLCAGYVRLHMTEEGSGAGKYFALSAAIILLQIAHIALCNHIGRSTGNYAMVARSTAMLGGSGFFVFLGAVTLFLAFRQLPASYSGFVNKAAGLTFGVYLMHENQLLRTLWQPIFGTAGYADSSYLWLHAIISIALVYIACSLTELLRQYTLGRLWTWFVDKLLLPLWYGVKNRLYRVKETSQTLN